VLYSNADWYVNPYRHSDPDSSDRHADSDRHGHPNADWYADPYVDADSEAVNFPATSSEYWRWIWNSSNRTRTRAAPGWFDSPPRHNRDLVHSLPHPSPEAGVSAVTRT
jgi:hypothetical protein